MKAWQVDLVDGNSIGTINQYRAGTDDFAPGQFVASRDSKRVRLTAVDELDAYKQVSQWLEKNR